MKFLKVIPFLLLAFVLIGFQNCANKSFSQRTSSVVAPLEEGEEGFGGDSSGGGNGGSGGSANNGGANNGGGSGSGTGGSNGGGSNGNIQDVVDETRVNCDNAEAQRKMQLSMQKISFADTKVETGRSRVCEFNQNGNLGMLNEYMQARYEQHRRLVLPANAVVCDLEMSTQIQRFKYDDVFFFTYNNRVLATNNKMALFQNPSESSLTINSRTVPIYKYDWLNLRTLPFVNVADDYCLGLAQNAAQCRWPLTERQGDIYFDFDRDLLIALGSRAPANEQNFGFIITGDNDPNDDCFHEHLEFDITVKYYLK